MSLPAAPPSRAVAHSQPSPPRWAGDGDSRRKIIQDALCIESDDVVNCCFTKMTRSGATASSADGCKPRRPRLAESAHPTTYALVLFAVP